MDLGEGRRLCRQEAGSIIHTHPFNGPLSGTITQVSRFQKGKTNLDFTEERDSERQWHQLGHMQVCTSLQTDNYASTPPLSFYRPDALSAAQPTASKHWRRDMIHNITEKRRESSSLCAANESRFTWSNMDEYGIQPVRLCVIWIARFWIAPRLSYWAFVNA